MYVKIPGIPKTEPISSITLFFFSSRRRHTRCLSDWSSDVCSSDLLIVDGKVYDHIGFRCRGGVWRYSMAKNAMKFRLNRGHDLEVKDNWGRKLKATRSEERRVGKEGRSRWSPYH